MGLALTKVDSFYTDMRTTEPRQRVAFNTTGTYCAVGVMNNYGPSTGVFPAEVWIYKLAAGHWTKVAGLVTNTYWDNTETWQLALADNLTVLSIGNNSPIVHRWKSTGSDTWAADSYFNADGSTGTNSSYSGCAISADGNVAIVWNAYNGGNDVKLFVNVTTGTTAVRQTFSAAGADGWSGAWLSSDGKRLVIGKLVGYTTPAVCIYNSTTLAASSWALGSTVTIPGTVDLITNIKMTPNMNLIAVGYYDTDDFIEILQNTTGTTYVSLGRYASVPYDAVWSFGLSTAGALLTGDLPTDSALTKCWGVNDVKNVTVGSALVEVPKPAGITAVDWCGSVDLDPSGTWACVQGGGYSPNTADTVFFCTVAAYTPPSAFWQDFDKTFEVIS